MSRKIELSRRNLLATMGAIGAGAALGGAGTMALFNDEEVFEGNRLVAGELDLKVDWQQAYYGAMDADVYGTAGRPYVNAFPDGDGDGKQDPIRSRDWLAQEHYNQSWADLSTGHNEDGEGQKHVERLFREQFADVPNDVPAPLIDLRDVKPGDRGEVTFSLHIFDNPAYMWLFGELQENLENGETEPESLVDETEGGDLADAIMARLWYDDGDNVYQDGETVFAEGTLADVLGDLEAGIALDAEAETDGRQCYPNSTTQYVAFEWWLPLETGNEVQSDSVSFDLRFYAEQCRHNDGVDELAGETGSGDFSPISYDKALSMQALSRAGSGRGEIQVHGDSDGAEDTYVFGNATFPADTDVPFTATVDPDAETASLTVNDRTVTDTDVTDGTANGSSIATADPEWPGGVPGELDVALTAMSGTSAVTTVVKEVTVNGTPVAPGSITAQDDLTYLNVTDIAASGPVTVAGVLRFEGATDDFGGTTFVGIDWR